MALTLTAALGVPTQLDPAIRLAITGTVPAAIAAGYQFRLEGEVLELKYFGKTQEDILGGAATQTVDDRNVWYAQRGLNGTTIASHAATTALLGVADPALVAGDDEDVPTPFASGGGGPHSTTHEDAGADEVRTRVTDTVEDVEATEIEFVFEPGGGFGAVGEDILPATDQTHNLGSAALRWVNVRASGAVTAGDTIAGPYALLASGSLEIYGSALEQRVGINEAEFYIADAVGLRILEFADQALTLRDGDAASHFGLSHLELQDAGGGTAFRVELGVELDIRVPALPTADPATAGRLYTYADNSGAGLVANLLTQIAAGARIVLQSNPA